MGRPGTWEHVGIPLLLAHSACGSLRASGVRTRVDALQEAKDNIYFSNMVDSVSCIKMIAKVRDNKDISVLMDFMNGLRKVASKHLFVKMQTLLNTTLLEKISINYEVTIHEGDTGSTNQR